MQCGATALRRLTLSPLSLLEEAVLRDTTRSSGPGLKLRLWLGCIMGGLFAGLGSLWVLGTHAPPGTEAGPSLLGWLSGVAFGAIVMGVVFALYLDHHIAGHLRGLLAGVRSGRVAELRGLPAASGWGELSDLGDALQDLLNRQRSTGRAGVQLEQQRLQLEALRSAIERWQVTETWDAPALHDGEVAAIADRLGHALQRRAAIDDQNREAARLVATELGGVLADAQESAEQTERGFVEATALMTTVRELQRLSAELTTVLAAATTAPAPAAAIGPAVGEAARAALEELVAASGGSVEALGRGLLRVQDVADQVQRLANRATLIAIQAISAGGDAALADELKQLARDVREATDRTTQYAMDIEGTVAEAGAIMRAAREGAIARLDAVASAPADNGAPAKPTRAMEDASRLLERVREMVQDAASKGERLSASGERTSRVAERLARRLDSGAADAEALAVRLAPVGEEPEATPGLRLLAREDRAMPPADDPSLSGDEAGGRGEAGSGEERP